MAWRGDPLLPPVQHFLENKFTKQQVLFQRIPWVNDPQAAHLLLLMCGATRANFCLRALRPEDIESNAIRLDEDVWSCLRQILGTPNASVVVHTLSTLSLSEAGLGLASAVRVPWRTLRMVRHRHPAIAERKVVGLKSTTLLRVSVRSGSASKQYSMLVSRSLTGMSWPTALHLRRGSRAQSTQGQMATVGHREVGTEVCARGGVACSQRTSVLMGSQHGPLASAPLTALPTSKVTRLEAQPFRVFLCRRLHLPPSVHAHLPMWPPT